MIRFLFCTLTIVLVASTAGTQVPPAKGDAKKVVGFKEKIESHEYEGRLVKNENDTITIIPFYHHAIDSRIGEQPVKPGTPNMSFPISVTLAKRKNVKNLPFSAPHPHYFCAYWMYSLSDMKACDTIRVYLDDSTGRMEIRFLNIERRPGGKVPMAPEDEDNRFPINRVSQELQDFEEKGQPLKFTSGQPRIELEARLTARVKHVKAVLAEAEKIEAAKKSNEKK